VAVSAVSCTCEAVTIDVENVRRDEEKGQDGMTMSRMLPSKNRFEALL
jgi:hypothetical protein